MVSDELNVQTLEISSLPDGWRHLKYLGHNALEFGFAPVPWVLFFKKAACGQVWAREGTREDGAFGMVSMYVTSSVTIISD